MEKSIYSRRLDLLRDRLQETDGEPCDTVWVIRPENRRYLSGFRAQDLQFTELSGSLLINKTRSLLVTDSRYLVQAEEEAVDFQVQVLKKDLAEELAQLIDGLGTKRLGFEAGYLTWGLHAKLKEQLSALSPAVDLVPLNGLIEEMREIKDGEELSSIRGAADLISGIFRELIPSLRPGMREKEVAWEIEALARDGGAEALSFPSIVASGPNSAMPHAVPTDRRIGPREPVIIDAGVRLEGYCSDMTRTVFLEGPDEEFRKIYKTVRHAQVSALKEVRPMVESTRLDSAARLVIEEAGFGERFGHGLGHGVGLAVHEGPKVGPRNPVNLREGMVFTVEPGIYIPGRGGVRLEEMVLVTDRGPEVLTGNRYLHEF
ncbi:MAG: aminopeptidase P family protein [Deltaproteobacteria bacterium]|nr:aminopeptidase P family protein [Deltaproteobacteria bacterium]MBW2111323.1 aminopeptidase P family protein [Deltaproteobacteria bacterium]MBW2353310.1 aminopeptidase P family protein [Deltaproteobacteria bacterium]HDZ90820.1 M24 family metallopeptidase [Deltaproteobacteria bacterium]